MSTLKVATIQDTSGNNSSTPAGIASGRAKAWAVFDQDSGVTELNDYNVSSVTDIATGRFSVHFAVAFSNANYVGAGMAGNRTGSTTNGRDMNRDGEWTTGIAYHRVTNDVASQIDDSYVAVVYFGD